MAKKDSTKILNKDLVDQIDMENQVPDKAAIQTQTEPSSNNKGVGVVISKDGTDLESDNDRTSFMQSKWMYL
jgi:hypothetical protein